MSIKSLKIFTPYQTAWINDRASMKLAEKSRRIGWSFADAFASVEDSVLDRCDTFYSSADDGAAREYMLYCADFAELFNKVAKYSEAAEMIDGSEIQTKKLTFENGRRIVAGTSNPNFFRSKGGNAKLDELAFHRDGHAMAKAAQPTSIFWGHQFSAWSSHNGSDSYFNRMIQDARGGKLKASVHRVNIYDAVEGGIVERIIMRRKKLEEPPAPDAKARQEWLDELRATCPSAAIWAEEYECQPSDSNRAFLAYDLIRSCEEPNLKPVGGGQWAVGGDVEKLSGTCYAGYDVGRSRDLSVLWVIELVGDVFWTRMVKVLKNASFREQADLLNRTLGNSAVKRLCIDKGLIGLQLAEDLGERWGYRAEGVQLGAAVQSEAAMLVLGSMEDRRIRLPDEESIRVSLHKPRRVMLGGNVRLETPRDEAGHCDEFWSLCLARLAAAEEGRPLEFATTARKGLGW